MHFATHIAHLSGMGYWLRGTLNEAAPLCRPRQSRCQGSTAIWTCFSTSRASCTPRTASHQVNLTGHFSYIRGQYQEVTWQHA